jgi:hypothetical protein
MNPRLLKNEKYSTLINDNTNPSFDPSEISDSSLPAYYILTMTFTV